MRLLLSLVLACSLLSAPASAYYPYRSFGFRPYNPGYVTGFGAGGYYGGYGGYGYYQPWSSFSNPYGTTFNGGMFTPWGYSPYSFSVPAYNPYGFGYGGGF